MSEDLDRTITYTYRIVGILAIMALTYVFGYTMAKYSDTAQPAPAPYVLSCPKTTTSKLKVPQTLTTPI